MGKVWPSEKGLSSLCSQGVKSPGTQPIGRPRKDPRTKGLLSWKPSFPGRGMEEGNPPWNARSGAPKKKAPSLKPIICLGLAPGTPINPDQPRWVEEWKYSKARGRTLVKNSASWHRKFARRCAYSGEAPGGWSLRGCNKESLPTVYQKHSTMLTSNWMYMV